jgi:hypothetical protein
MFADCTGDAVLVQLAGGETVKGNLDVSDDVREKYALDDTYASLGSTLFFYTKKTEAPVRFVAPSFAYTLDEMEAILAKNGKLLVAPLANALVALLIHPRLSLMPSRAAINRPMTIMTIIMTDALPDSRPSTTKGAAKPMIQSPQACVFVKRSEGSDTWQMKSPDA